MFAYVGSRTTRERNARGDGITVCRFDPHTGQLDPVQVVGGLTNPSFLQPNRAGDRLYAVHGDQEWVSAFAVDHDTGQLTHLNTQSCQGRNPVHLALDPAERHLVVSNHVTSAMAVLAIEPDGRLGALTQLLPLDAPPGPHRVEQPFAKPHFNPFDPSGRWVLVPDKGADRVFVFRFDNGRLVPADVPCAVTREGAGPRHLAFHPQHPWVYVINELDSTVTTYHWHNDTGALEPFQLLSALADTYTGNSRASEIEVHPKGHTLYASNRGEDSIAVFAIEAATGRLRLRQTQPAGGRTPRFFTTDPSGRWLFVLNEDSDTITTHAIGADGSLQATGASLACGSPVCLVFGKV